MKHFLEELIIAALAWIPTAAGMGARLLLWRPLFKRCGRARFGTGIAMQGCKNMSLADGVRIGRGCQLYAEGGTLDMGEDAALSPGVTVDLGRAHPHRQTGGHRPRNRFARRQPLF